MRKLHLVLFALVVLVFLFALFALHVTAERFLTDGVRRAVGSPVHIADIRIDWIHSQVRFYGLRVLNPQGFRGDTMAYIPEIIFQFDRQALVKREIHFRDLKLTCQHLAIEKNPKNWVNVIEIGPVRERFDRSDSTAKVEAASSRRFRIDHAEINLLRGVVTDYSQGDKPSIREFSMDVKGKTIHDITDPAQLTLYVVLVGILKAGWQTLDPEPTRLPQAFLMQGDALLQEVQKIFEISEENLRNLLQS